MASDCAASSRARSSAARPILVLTGRPQDGWLATWSLADLAVPHPLDPIALACAVAELRSWRHAPARPDRRGRTGRPAGHTWPDLLTLLLAGSDLTTDQAAWAMDQIMSGEATPVQVAGFLVALRAKGETVEELRGLADVMLAHANRIEVPGPSLDIVGTGGDRSHTVNISTMAAVVVAAAGRPGRQARQPRRVLGLRARPTSSRPSASASP